MTVNNILPEIPEFNTMSVTLPSGMVVKIRERNGEDEDILSNQADAETGDSIAKYLSRIIVACNKKFPISATDINNWRIRDKYYLLYKSTMFSLGKEITFKHQFQENGPKKLIEEDISIFDWDLSGSKPPAPDEEGYNPYVIQPYDDFDLADKSEWITKTLSSGKEIRFKYLTGVGEKITLGMDKNNVSINTELRIRDFQLKKDSTWADVQNFARFTAKEMREIRKELRSKDFPFDPVMELTDGGKKYLINLFDLQGFLFPAE